MVKPLEMKMCTRFQAHFILQKFLLATVDYMKMIYITPCLNKLGLTNFGSHRPAVCLFIPLLIPVNWTGLSSNKPTTQSDI